jgi:hypothetical protein
MLGFGLRLDTPWQAPAWLLIGAGVAVAAWGLAGSVARPASTASVLSADGE